MKNKMIISNEDFQQICEQIYTDPEFRKYEDFAEFLENADKVESHKIPAGTVRLNSSVELFDPESQEVINKMIVLPPALLDHELSVLSPVGMAVFGKKKQSTVKCEVPQGTRVLQLKNVIQPQAVYS